MWTAWAIFYMSLWICASGLVIGGDNQFINLVGGLILIVLSFWIGIIYRKSLFIRTPPPDKMN